LTFGHHDWLAIGEFPNEKAASMENWARDLGRLNAALQAELNQVRAEIDELKVLVKLRQQSDMEGVTRMRTIHEALGIPRDPIRPLQ
jgi:uncharacterized protein with GYD domain